MLGEVNTKTLIHYKSSRSVAGYDKVLSTCYAYRGQPSNPVRSRFFTNWSGHKA